MFSSASQFCLLGLPALRQQLTAHRVLPRIRGLLECYLPHPVIDPSTLWQQLTASSTLVGTTVCFG